MRRLHDVKLVVNNRKYELRVPSTERLIDTLRYRLGFTSVKEGCGRGECGNCIVLVNGKPRHSCITLTATMDGAEITTLEGIAQPGMLHAIQAAFVEAGGIQCGFCIPGMIMVVKALLDRNPNPPTDEIKQWLASVLCRCGNYYHYINAVKRASVYLRNGQVFFGEKEIRKKLYAEVTR